jgi:hypothetical protein
MDPSVTDVLTLRVTRNADGYFELFGICDSWDGLISDHIVRLYPSEAQASHVCGDAIEMLAGWGDLGVLGFTTACSAIRSVDRY